MKIIPEIRTNLPSGCNEIKIGDLDKLGLCHVSGHKNSLIVNYVLN